MDREPRVAQPAEMELGFPQRRTPSRAAQITANETLIRLAACSVHARSWQEGDEAVITLIHPVLFLAV